MSQQAPRVHTSQAEIESLQALIVKLREGVRVELLLDDGSRVLGTVTVQPTLQVFRDDDEQEGSNSLLRLDDIDDPAQQHLVWLDTIEQIRELAPQA